MEPVLLLIILGIVVAIGVILSRPFMKIETSHETPNPAEEQEAHSSSHTDADPDHEIDQTSNQMTQNGYSFCPKCGHQVISSDKFCTICGHRLQS